MHNHFSFLLGLLSSFRGKRLRKYPFIHAKVSVDSARPQIQNERLLTKEIRIEATTFEDIHDALGWSITDQRFQNVEDMLE